MILGPRGERGPPDSYVLAATVHSSAGQVIRPAHLVAAAAVFMVILSETGRIPGWRRR